jgi:predicted transcriptional regulator
MIQDMKALLITLDRDTAERLEEVAPARSHKRSAFIRAAILKALDAIVEERMAEAYRRQPQREEEGGWFDPGAWEKETWTDEDVIAGPRPVEDHASGRGLRAAERKGGGYRTPPAASPTSRRGGRAGRAKPGRRS